MSDLFDALQNFKPVEKKHYVVIQDQKIEVSLEKKLEIIRNGEANYLLRDNIPVLKQIKTRRNSFPEIDNFNSDPFWPKEQFVWRK